MPSWAASIWDAWHDHPYLTPRQATELATTLAGEAFFIKQWMSGDPRSGCREPLQDVLIVLTFDLRVMMLINESPAWAAMAAERMEAIHDEILKGILPFNRRGCFFDEAAMEAAAHSASQTMADSFEERSGFAELVPERVENDGDDESYRIGDDDWDSVFDYFADAARFPEWEARWWAARCCRCCW